jgi:hypothetical protein
MATFSNFKSTLVAAADTAAGVTAGVTVYANRSSLPASGNTQGDQAYVTGNNRLYIWNGSGWYNVALLNLAPSIQSVLDSDNNQSPFSLAIDGTPTTITITATDSDGDPITYGYNADSNFNGLATLSQANNVFTITPFSQDSATTTSGTITFTATDDVNVASSGVQTFTLNFLSPLWDETVLSVGTSSTNSLNNSTFIDRSTNSHTVTTSGTPTQTAFHPYLDSWSVKFDGNDFFSTTMAETIGTGDFTIEAYVNHTGGTDDVIISTAGCSFVYGVTGQLRFYTGTGQNLVNSGVSYISNRWVHVAAVRTSGVLKMFQDGTEIYSAAYTHNIASFGSSYIGKYHAVNVAYFEGNISNLRIVVGSALYTSNFTPSIEKLTAVSGTSLLTCQSNRFIDNSTNNYTFTTSGDPEISAFNPFGQGSEYAVSQNKGSTYFNGASSIDTLGSILANHTWTIEFWGYITSFSNANYIISVYTDSTVTSNIGISSTGFSAQIYGNSGSLNANGTFSYNTSNKILNQWCHIAITHEYGGSSDTNAGVRFFVNGVDIGTHPNLGTYDFSRGGNDLKIGVYYYSTSNNHSFWNGYISDFTITPSVKYTAGVNFTPPTTPVGNINASLYLPMDNTGIFDKTGNNTLTLSGNTSISTTQTKYADTAIYFDGINDYMLAGPNEFYDNDFTIELWWYPTSTSRQALMHGSWGNDWSIGIDYSSISSNQKIGIWASSNGSSWNLINSDSGGNGIGSETINQNAWNHIAYTRSGTTWRLFVNGVLDVELTSISGSIARPTQQIAIGAWWSSSSMSEINGYIENFQILKGVAKYTANFTPPTKEQGRLYQAED